MNLKFNLTFLVLMLLVNGCVLNIKTSKDSFSDVNSIILEYGICATDALYNQKMEASPSGNYTRLTGFKLLEQTDTIPAKIGQEFGVHYILKSDVTKSITIEQIWNFPKAIINKEGKVFTQLRYEVNKTTNSRTYSTYILEKDYEIVKGEWTYQMRYAGKKLYERKFILE